MYLMGMLIRRRKFETFSVRREIVRIRRPSRGAIAWCAACDYQAPMLMPEEAAALAGVTTREIYRRIESGGLHFAEISTRSVLICMNSITQPVSN